MVGETAKIVAEIVKLIFKSCKGNPVAATQVMSDVGKQLSQNGASMLLDVMKKGK